MTTPTVASRILFSLLTIVIISNARYLDEYKTIPELLTYWRGQKYRVISFHDRLVDEIDAFEMKLFFQGETIYETRFEDCTFIGASFEIALEGLRGKPLQDFTLRNMKLNEKQAYSIANVDTSNIQLHSVSMSTSTFEILTFALQTLKRLQFFTGSNLDLTREKLVALANAIQKNRIIHYIDVPGCNIKDISPFSRVNSLSRLGLHRNQITLEKNGEIDVYRNNPEVKVIELAQNKISKGILKLISFLLERRDIGTIILSDNQIGPYSMELVPLFAQKRILVGVSLEGNDIPMSNAKILLKAAKLFREQNIEMEYEIGVRLKRNGGNGIYLPRKRQHHEDGAFYCGTGLDDWMWHF
jgi:hypothetical protein